MDATLTGLLFGCAEASDSTPHLILADWLEDHGQPERAAFVRLQCRLADWVPDWQERQTLLARQDELLAAHRAAWLGPLAERCERIEFVRGLCRVWVRSQQLASAPFGDALREQQAVALVEEVRVTHCKGLSRVLNRPWLALVPSLSLARLELNSAGLDPLFTSPHLDQLVSLDLSGTAVNGSELQRLVSAPFRGKLARLGLRNCGLTEAQVQALLNTAPASLRELDVGALALAPATLDRLAVYTPANRLRNALGMEFLRVPAGSFLMGAQNAEAGLLSDQQPRHEVTLARPYWLGRFAVTQGQYQAVMDDNPSRFTSQGPALPVENVDYESVTEFCRRLGQRKEERRARRTYRLPTEAEWEYACRGGTFTPFYSGDAPSPDLMNYRGRFNSNEPERPHPGRPLAVGSYPPNPFGLYEMAGNIWEWTSDWYDDEWYGQSVAVDPTGPATGDTKAIRGGCWHAVGICLRSAHRFGEELDTRDDYTGFRVVLVEAG